MLRIITLVFAIFLTFAVAFPGVDAHVDTHFVRDHAPAVRRMIRKRASRLEPTNAQAAGPNVPPGNPAGLNPLVPPPNSDTLTVTQSRPDNSPTPTDKVTIPVTGLPTNLPSVQASSDSNGLLFTIINPTQTANKSISTSSASSTTSVSTTSAISTTPSSSSTTSSLSPSDTPTSSAQTSSVVEVTVTSSASPTATSAPSTGAASVSKLQRNTIIILIAIGASIGAAGIIWTIIRKWKFRPSSSFEDRMQPIDWQPTTAPHDDRDITEKINRSPSVRTHGSFTSGNNHDNLTAEIPSHDFTAGPSHLAPVGGYLDLQRGPSPQPDLQRGTSFRTPNPYEYNIPNPHGQYYGAGAGAYQAGYEHDRGY